MFVYLLYINEAFVNTFRVSINDVQGGPQLFLHVWVMIFPIQNI